MLTPSCPMSLVQCQCFLLALITVLESLRCQWQLVSFHPVSECPAQSLNKSLITAVTSIKKTIPVYIPPFVDAITLM
ncbi:unnamed protein product [Staurois parvus]|uniref:Secreted protein n=1 Tax=Staurois parvus TaxID=386267 RepID=A0ABN9EJK0_9NEOB|nr:unnamed protein product [Staurois parvus]